MNNSINNPLVYDNGWGYSFGSVFEIKSNGYLTPVTATYSDSISTIIIYALDDNDNPIDGAKITLKVSSGWDNWGYTDNEGKCTFIVGDGRTYYARIDSDIGGNPANPNSVLEVVSNSINGQTYTYSFNAPGVMPEVIFTEIAVPDDDIDDYLIEIDFSVPDQIICGAIIMDDLDYTDFYNGIEEEGFINLFMADHSNFTLYEVGDPFETFNVFSNAANGFIEFDIPIDSDWYAFFDNGNHLNNPQQLTASISLYSYSSNEAEDHGITSSPISLKQNYPNPFNPSTTISFSVTQTSSFVTLDIYNLKGQKVKTLECINRVNAKTTESFSHHSVIWNGTDDSGKPVSSGIYFYKLNSSKISIIKKMILLR